MCAFAFDCVEGRCGRAQCNAHQRAGAKLLPVPPRFVPAVPVRPSPSAAAPHLQALHRTFFSADTHSRGATAPKAADPEAAAEEPRPAAGRDAPSDTAATPRPGGWGSHSGQRGAMRSMLTSKQLCIAGVSASRNMMPRKAVRSHLGAGGAARRRESWPASDPLTLRQSPATFPSTQAAAAGQATRPHPAAQAPRLCAQHTRTTAPRGAPCTWPRLPALCRLNPCSTTPPPSAPHPLAPLCGYPPRGTRHPPRAPPCAPSRPALPPLPAQPTNSQERGAATLDLRPQTALTCA